MTVPASRPGGSAIELRICFGLLLLAAGLSAVDRWQQGGDDAPLPTRGQLDAMDSAWQGLLLDLVADAEHAAERVRRTVTAPPRSPRASQRVFEELGRVGGALKEGRTLLLVDADGLPQAWGGPGLRHDLPLDRLRPGEIHQNAGFTAVSLYTAVDLGMGGWQLIAGNSFPTDSLPIPAPFGLRGHGVRWSVRAHSAEPLTPDLEALGIRELAPPRGLPGPWLRLRFEQTTERSWSGTAALALAAAVLGGGLFLSWLFRRWTAQSPGRPRPAVAVPGVAVIAAAVGYGLFRWQIRLADTAGAPVDPGSLLGGPISHWAVLLASWLVLAGAAFWVSGWPEGRDWLHVLMTASAAAAGVGLLVEASHRPALRTLLAKDFQGDFDARTREEVGTLARRTSAFLASTDLRELALGDPRELDDHQDLALDLWIRSPLAASEMISALVVVRENEEVSTFSYGVPVDATPEGLVSGRAGRTSRDLRAWLQQRSVTGEVPVVFAGQEWGTVSYQAAPSPEVEVWSSRSSGAGAEPEVRLLRGGPNGSGSGPDPPAGAVLAYVDGAGRPLVSPWQQDWLLPAPSEAVDPRRSMRVETPAGPALAWFGPTRLPGLWIVALLPEEAMAKRLWRIATVAARLTLAVAVVAFSVLLVSLPTAKLRRRLMPGLRRYSVRLTAVLALIAIVPLTLLNGLLVRSLAARVQAEQEAAGRAALVSLESMLTTYILSLEAGFSIEAELDDELLAWLARVVGHEINLYWHGRVYASSKPDLFTAGLMPKRIPGNVYSRLALLGHPTAARVQTTRQGTSFLELYRPVSLGEVRPGESGLFVSVPLLALQEAATRELAALRRQTLVVTIALVLLLVTVGARLARGFTRPLMRMIDGAERIAGGATSLGFAPQETELRTLAQAIDGMAARIASTRAREEAEKRLLEGVVENITSGIVSLDGEGRVVMANRNAAGLLGVSVGQSMAATNGAGRGPGGSLEAVADLVRRSSSTIRKITVSFGVGDTRRDWTVIWVPVPGDGDPAALLVIEDVTDVFRAHRLEAWAEMARLIAHEVKNPLTPIRLSTEHLRQVWRDAPDRLEEVFEQCTDNILVQVDELARTAGEFLTYSRIPIARPAPDDLAGAVQEVVDGYGAAVHGGAAVVLEAPPDTAGVPLAFDRRLMQRALRNLIQNALRASAGDGEVLVGIDPGRPDGTVSVTVSDRGPGVSGSDLERIFEPYFSTSIGGTGLGLPIARRIVQEHGGSITAAARPGGGLSVCIVLPRGDQPAEAVSAAVSS